MSEFVISTRYANALMSLSEENGSFEKVLDDIGFIKSTLDDTKELRSFLSSPIINADNKMNVLKEIFNSHVGNEINNFLKFLVDKGRENILFDICDRFLTLSNEKLNRVDVNITSAIELNETQKNEIKLKLESILSKKVIPSYSIDNEIIGGFKAKYNDTVIDASIKHQLEALKKKLFEEDYLKN